MATTMKRVIVIGATTLAVAGVAGCESNSRSGPQAPFASAYNATYATADMNVISELLVNPGDKVQGAAAPVFGDFSDSPAIRSLDEPQAVEIEKTADGYILRYGGEEVEFTSAQLNNGYYELFQDDSNGVPRSLGFLSSFTSAPTDQALAANDSSAVPFGFGVRVKTGDDPATADDSDAYVNGYAVVGLETDPSDMPTTGTATYRGYGQVDASEKTVDFSVDEIDRVAYRGSAQYLADFGAGTVSGSMTLEDTRTRMTISGNSPWTDVSAAGGQIMLTETEIIDNGFASDLEANAAAEAMFAADGLSDDVEAQAVGRFYGSDAGEIHAIVAGESSSHIITGIISADRLP